MPELARRDFLKITALASGVLAGGLLLGRRMPAGFFSLKDSRVLMGTIVHLTVISQDEAQGRLALEGAFAEMERQIRLFDHRDPHSPLFALNRDGYLLDPPGELEAVLERAKEISDLSQGAFDVTVKPLVDARARSLDIDEALMALVDYRQVSIGPGELRLGRAGMQVTLDGIAKGRVVDGGVAALRAAGYPDVLVEAGGDLLVGGRSASGDAWRIGLSHPRPEAQSGALVTFALSSGAAATSGDYLHTLTLDRAQHHIIDPRVGLSPTELASVTVLAEDATTADALATAIMVLGADEGLALADSLAQVEALAFSKHLEARHTAAFPELG